MKQQCTYTLHVPHHTDVARELRSLWGTEVHGMFDWLGSGMEIVVLSVPKSVYIMCKQLRFNPYTASANYGGIVYFQESTLYTF